MDPVHPHRPPQPTSEPPVQPLPQSSVHFPPGAPVGQNCSWVTPGTVMDLQQQQCVSLPPGFLQQTQLDVPQNSQLHEFPAPHNTPIQVPHFVGPNWISTPASAQTAPGCGLGELSTPFFFTQAPQRLEQIPLTAPGNLAAFGTELQTPCDLDSLGGAVRQQQTTPSPQPAFAPGIQPGQEHGFGGPMHTVGSSTVFQSPGATIPCMHPLTTIPNINGAPPSATGRGQWFHSGMPVTILSSERGGLHHEVEKFSMKCLPTDREAAAMDSLLRDLDRRIRRMFPDARRIILYGSQATGLALPTSDMDIVILGVGAQIFAPAEQFSNKDRRRVIQRLRHLQDNLERNDYLETGKCKVVEARVPIMKATLRSKGLDFKADISMGVKNAADAIGLICQHVSQTPMVRPLVLVLKALLRNAKLNEVYTGGISSYVLFNLVVAHLMLEGVCSNVMMKQGVSLDQISTMTERVRFLKHNVGSCPGDLGHLLLSFLDRFGNWRSERNKNLSISIVRGGLCLKQALNDVKDDCLLCVEDPQAPGRNATGGSFKMGAVLDVFRDAAQKLRLATSMARAQEGPVFQLLGSILPCNDVLARVPSLQDHSHKHHRESGQRSKRRHSSHSEEIKAKPIDRKRRRTESSSRYNKGS